MSKVAVPQHGATVDAASSRIEGGVCTTGVARSLIETTKPRITRLVTITSMVGFAMAAPLRGAIHTWSLWDAAWMSVVCAAGTALAAGGANAINQFMERGRDAVMPRTVGRPLPEKRVSPAMVLGLGVALSVLGCALLLVLGPAPALVALACVISYVAMYTPLKTRTTLATFVGAIPGALPPLIGWTAASPASGWEAFTQPLGLSLFALMFIWQIPHFLAIAWMYKDDYAKGGYVMLPVVDRHGGWTAATIALWGVALIPATLWPAVLAPERLGTVYAIVAAVTGIAYALLCLRLAMTRTRAAARAVFFGSIAHLPLLLMVMVGESIVRSW